MKNFILISDVHVNLNTLYVAKHVLGEALKLARQERCPLVIAGDLHDTKAVLRSEAVRLIKQLFEDYYDVRIVILIGNHDLENEKGEFHALDFLNGLQNISIIDYPQFYEDWYFIPYKSNFQYFKDAYDKAIKEGAKYFIIHQGINGMKMNNAAVDSSSEIKLDMFKDAKLVISGHYHGFQSCGNFMYAGSPYTKDFSEAGQVKLIHQVYQENDVYHIKSAKTNCRKHVIVEEYEDGTMSVPSDIQPYDIARVIVRGSKEFCLEHDRAHYQKILKMENVSVTPIIKSQSEVRITAAETLKPSHVFQKYLGNTQTTLDKAELQQYIESITGEKK